MNKTYQLSMEYIRTQAKGSQLIIGLFVFLILMAMGSTIHLTLWAPQKAVPYHPELARIEHIPVVQHISPQMLDELFLPETLDEEVLWVARAIYSETKRPEEMYLVAWVIRNRVETRYRGKSTYREVVLDPYQFSAFNPDNPVRAYYMHLTPESQPPGWETALKIAYYVVHADSSMRPFSIKTRHFYSERSMRWKLPPRWVQGGKEVSLQNQVIDKTRFRFYQNVM